MKLESKKSADKEVLEAKVEEVSINQQAPIGLGRFLFRNGNSLLNAADNVNDMAQLNILPWRKRR